MVKPWTVPPTSASATVVKVFSQRSARLYIVFFFNFQWNLPLPSDMSDPCDPLVNRAIYIRLKMETEFFGMESFIFLGTPN